MVNEQINTEIADIRVAPMIDWTDRHCRYFLRQLSPNVMLYTEMVTCGALLHGDAERHLRFDDTQHPIALQLGGGDPDDLATCTKMGADAGYDEINLNCGCPSDRVQSGAFGACLMKDPDHVARCIAAMSGATDKPVNIKCRIGVDEFEDYDFLKSFVAKTHAAGCNEFIVHARKAWLKGLSPKQNREIPPLRYDVVHQLKQDFPDIRFVINGGITTIEQIKEQLALVDGVMIGREAYQNPYILAEIEKQIFKNESVPSRDEVALKMIDYAREQYEIYQTPVKSITRHILGLYQGLPRSKRWRRTLSEAHKHPEDYFDVIQDALDNMHSKKPETCIAA
jgi:tRNA-dihydrouridine synthase A|tara:strand:- start:426494 stop:427507 length:1014 start_codon:yes stop_codon:yes gene_type:complete